MNEKKLFLLDAYALIYRAYYALIRAPRVTSKGMNTSAIFGFVNTLEEVLRKESPSHIAVCFDPHGPTFRHEMYPEYKAQREKQPEDITISIPYIKDIIQAFGIRVIEVPGYEADDVIGTLARMADAEGFTTYMMTPDKDYGQLVTDHVFMYKPAMRGADVEVRGPREVCARHGITSPIQVIDLLALEGDAVDNIPGCPGVGEKTAAKLICEWGSVENLLANTASLKGALQKRVIENVEKIRFSKVLATIKTDVPVDMAVADLKLGTPDTQALARIYTELEFRTFLNRLPASATAASGVAAVETKNQAAPTASPASGASVEAAKPSAGADAPEAATAPAPSGNEGLMGSLFDMPDVPPMPEVKSYDATVAHYRTLTTPEEVAAYVARLSGVPAVGVASYAVGESDMTSRWQGIALSAAECEAVYVALPWEIAPRRALIEALKPLFTSASTLIVSHDVKREIMLFRRDGVEITAPCFDTAVAHYLLEPEMSHALPRIAATLISYHMIDYGADARLAKKGEQLPAGEEATRTCEAADVTLRLRAPLIAKIDSEGLRKLLDEVELPLISVLADMEWNGARVDVHALADLQRRFSTELHRMEEEAYALAGTTFNISSPSQVGEILFGRLQLDPKAKRTKSGGYSTTEEILDKYRDAHPLVGLILDIRGLRKLLTTYIDALPALINPSTGKIHTTYNQTVTATGRISSTNPNMQNIPIRTENGREIRRAFIADPGCVFMSADYSQIELRVIADISGDKDMIDAFVSGVDVHQATAAKIYHESLESVTPEQRTKAKTANFGIIYGISAFGLAQRLRIPRAEAKELIEGYFRTYPRIREYIDEAVAKAKEQGYVTTIMGRKRMLPDINSANAVVRGYAERNAVNAPIQGSAADIIKVAMVNVYRHLRERGLKSKMIMQVHDELIFNIFPDELDTVKEIVITDMMNAHKGKVPLEVSAGTGANWLQAH
jgi:DNA polymerase-1